MLYSITQVEVDEDNDTDNLQDNISSAGVNLGFRRVEHEIIFHLSVNNDSFSTALANEESPGMLRKGLMTLLF